MGKKTDHSQMTLSEKLSYILYFLDGLKSTAINLIQAVNDLQQQQEEIYKIVNKEPQKKIKRLKGVCYDRTHQRYKAQISKDGKITCLGYFDPTPEGEKEAHQAYLRAKQRQEYEQKNVPTYLGRPYIPNPYKPGDSLFADALKGKEGEDE